MLQCNASIYDIFFLDVPSVTVTLSTYNTNIGGTVTLGCTVVASPAATNVFWRRVVNNQQQNVDTTSVGTRYSGSTVSSPSLVISNVQSSDEGNYICFATNSIGTGESQRTYLDVIGSKFFFYVFDKNFVFFKFK